MGIVFTLNMAEKNRPIATLIGLDETITELLHNQYTAAIGRRATTFIIASEALIAGNRIDTAKEFHNHDRQP